MSVITRCLTTSLKRHLQGIEAELLDHLALSLIGTPAEVTHSMSHGNAGKAEAKLPAGCAVASPCRSPLRLFTRRNKKNPLFQKVCTKLRRLLSDLCRRFGLARSITQQVWYYVRHCLTHHMSLLRERKLHHLAIGAVYLVCEALLGKGRVRLQDVVKAHADAAHRQPNLSGTVPLHHRDCAKMDDERDVKEFANCILIPATGDYLKVIGVREEAAPVLDPSQCLSPTKTLKPPQRSTISVRSPVYHRVPMKKGNIFMRMTSSRDHVGSHESKGSSSSGSRAFYVFGESGPADIKLINSAMNL